MKKISQTDRNPVGQTFQLRYAEMFRKLIWNSFILSHPFYSSIKIGKNAPSVAGKKNQTEA